MSEITFPSLAPNLRGELVSLTQLDSRFVEEAFAAVNEPESRRLTATSKVFSRAEIEAWLASRPGALERLDWAILVDGQYVGEVVLNEFVAAKKSMNMRIALAGPSVFGRGYGSDALGLVVDYAFDRLKLDWITLEVLVENSRAIGTYEKVGFVAGRQFSEGKHRFLRMKLNKFDRVFALAERKLAEHLDPQVWSFGWDNARRRAGLCNYTDRRISLSTYYAQVHSIDDSMQVLLHEIAHALTGKDAAHGKVWLNKAKSIGYRAEKFTGREIAEEFAPWVGTCPNGHQHYRYRKPTRGLSCALCSRTYSRANLIEWQSR